MSETEPPDAEPPVEDPDPTDDEDESLPTGAVLARVAGDQFYRLSIVAQFGVVIVGGALALVALGPGEGMAGSLRIGLTIALAGLASLVVGQLLRGFGALLHVQADAADATGRIEQRLADSLARLSEAVETIAEAPRPEPSGRSAADQRSEALAEIHHAIRSSHWADAQTLVEAFVAARPDDPEAARLTAELAAARQAAGQALLAKIEAAREVNDPDRVIELREALGPLLDPEATRSLDRDLARWFLMLIHKRLRTGTVRADVAVLAARVADALDDTPEGASLRASLPTLRRAAGLCGRCGQPYTGLAAACPSCVVSLAAASASPAPGPGPSPVPSPGAPQADPDADPEPVEREIDFEVP